jgi:S-(hydroxymethyl)glutathione dehydrogenase/alcohol dehydrogenase
VILERRGILAAASATEVEGASVHGEGDNVKAAVCYEFGRPLVVEDILLDRPSTGEIRVRLAACAICHSDISCVDGAWGGELPAVYGHEAAGVVEDVGPDVEGVVAGDHVVVSLIRSCGRCHFCAGGEPALCDATFALDERAALHTGDGRAIVQGIRTGAFAERVLVHASQAAVIPSDMPLDSAALLACGVVTGLGAVVNTARVRPGESVVVVGTGGVGLNSVQGARLAGAQPIVAVDVLDEKLQAALAFGATHTASATAEVREVVRSLTDGRGADHVVVTVGSKSAIEDGLRLVRRGGNLVVVGMPPSGVTIELDPMELAHDGRRILGSKVGSVQPAVEIPRLAGLYRDGRLKLDELISGRYALDQINDAVASARRGEALRHVIVF